MKGPLVKAAIEAAQNERGRLGIGLNGPLPDILAIVEQWAGVPVIIAALPDGVAGAYQRRRGQAFILLNGNDPVVRRRFTLAHEFGHATMGHRSAVDRVETMFGSKDPQEIQANYFAGEFLAPERAVSTWLELQERPELDLEAVVRLAAAFGISAESALVRLDIVSSLTPKKKRQLKEEIERGTHTRLASRLGIHPIADSLAGENSLPRVPPAILANGLTAIGAGASTPERLAEALHTDPAAVRQMMAESGVDEPEDEPDF